MAEKVKEGEGTMFLNKGLRRYDLGVDKDGKARRHDPGATMLYTAEEAKRHEGYSDLIDISKMPASVNAKKLKAENEKLLEEKLALEARIAALEGKSKKSDKAKEEVVKETVQA